MSIKARLKQVPLHTRLKVLSEMAFIDLLTRLGYRRDEEWYPEEEEKLQELCNAASEHVDDILKTFDKWKEDGKP